MFRALLKNRLSNQLGRRYFTFSTKNIRLVVLDGSGTIIDPGVYAPAIVFKKVFDKFRVPVTMEQIRKPMGMEKREHIRQITLEDDVKERWLKVHNREPTEDDINDMFSLFEPIELKVLEKYGLPITGALDAMHEIKNNGIMLGLSTGFNRNMVNKILEINPLINNLLDTHVAGDEVSMGRPSPFMVYKNMMDMLIIDPTTVVKVDDTELGIYEGVNAGCWTIGLSKLSNSMGMTEEEVNEFKENDPEGYDKKHSEIIHSLKKAGANFVVDDITKVPHTINRINELLYYGHTTSLKM